MSRILRLYVIIHPLWSDPSYTLQPQELVPIHPIHNVQDWDAPAGAITWPRLVKFLQTVKETGQIPPDHRSHDHLNEQKDIKIDPDVRDRWIEEFRSIKTEKEAALDQRIVWGLVDGFLLYWNQACVDHSRPAIFSYFFLGRNRSARCQDNAACPLRCTQEETAREARVSYSW